MPVPMMPGKPATAPMGSVWKSWSPGMNLGSAAQAAAARPNPAAQLQGPKIVPATAQGVQQMMGQTAQGPQAPKMAAAVIPIAPQPTPPPQPMMPPQSPVQAPAQAPMSPGQTGQTGPGPAGAPQAAPPAGSPPPMPGGPAAQAPMPTAPPMPEVVPQPGVPQQPPMAANPRPLPQRAPDGSDLSREQMLQAAMSEAHLPDAASPQDMQMDALGMGGKLASWLKRAQLERSASGEGSMKFKDAGPQVYGDEAWNWDPRKRKASGQHSPFSQKAAAISPEILQKIEEMRRQGLAQQSLQQDAGDNIGAAVGAGTGAYYGAMARNTPLAATLQNVGNSVQPRHPQAAALVSKVQRWMNTVPARPQDSWLTWVSNLFQNGVNRTPLGPVAAQGKAQAGMVSPRWKGLTGILGGLGTGLLGYGLGRLGGRTVMAPNAALRQPTTPENAPQIAQALGQPDLLKQAEALSPTAQGFFSYCEQLGLDQAQIKQAIDKVSAAEWGEEIKRDLEIGFEKRAAPGAGMGQAIGNTLRRFGNWFGIGGGPPGVRQLLPEARNAYAAARNLTVNPAAGQAGAARFLPRAPEGAIPFGLTPPTAAGAAMNTVRQNVRQTVGVPNGYAPTNVANAPPQSWRGMIGSEIPGMVGMGGAGYGLARLQGQSHEDALGEAAMMGLTSPLYGRNMSMMANRSRGWGAAAAPFTGALGGSMRGRMGGMVLDTGAHLMGVEGTNFEGLGGTLGGAFGAARGLGRTGMNWGLGGQGLNAFGTAGVNRVAAPGTMVGNAVMGRPLTQGIHPQGMGGLARASNVGANLAAGAGTILGARQAISGVGDTIGRHATQAAVGEIAPHLPQFEQHLDDMIGGAVQNQLARHNLLDERGQFSLANAMRNSGGGMLDGVLQRLGLDPSRMSPSQRTAVMAGIPATGLGAMTGNPLLAGGGMAATGYGLQGQGQPQGQQHANPATPLWGNPGSWMPRNEYEHMLRTTGQRPSQS